MTWRDHLERSNFTYFPYRQIKNLHLFKGLGGVCGKQSAMKSNLSNLTK